MGAALPEARNEAAMKMQPTEEAAAKVVTTAWLCGCRSGRAAKAGLLVYALIHEALTNRAINRESGFNSAVNKPLNLSVSWDCQHYPIGLNDSGTQLSLQIEAMRWWSIVAVKRLLEDRLHRRQVGDNSRKHENPTINSRGRFSACRPMQVSAGDPSA
jgi:hypothetical protein